MDTILEIDLSPVVSPRGPNEDHMEKLEDGLELTSGDAPEKHQDDIRKCSPGKADVERSHNDESMDPQALTDKCHEALNQLNDLMQDYKKVSSESQNGVSDDPSGMRKRKLKCCPKLVNGQKKPHTTFRPGSTSPKNKALIQISITQLEDIVTRLVVKKLICDSEAVKMRKENLKLAEINEKLSKRLSFQHKMIQDYHKVIKDFFANYIKGKTTCVPARLYRSVGLQVGRTQLKEASTEVMKQSPASSRMANAPMCAKELMNHDRLISQTAATNKLTGPGPLVLTGFPASGSTRTVSNIGVEERSVLLAVSSSSPVTMNGPTKALYPVATIPISPAPPPTVTPLLAPLPPPAHPPPPALTAAPLHVLAPYRPLAPVRFISNATALPALQQQSTPSFVPMFSLATTATWPRSAPVTSAQRLAPVGPTWSNKIIISPTASGIKATTTTTEPPTQQPPTSSGSGITRKPSDDEIQVIDLDDDDDDDNDDDVMVSGGSGSKDRTPPPADAASDSKSATSGSDVQYRIVKNSSNKMRLMAVKPLDPSQSSGNRVMAAKLKSNGVVRKPTANNQAVKTVRTNKFLLPKPMVTNSSSVISVDIPTPSMDYTHPHPAPLPEAHQFYNSHRTNQMSPPKPRINIVLDGNLVSIQWDMDLTNKHTTIRSFEIFSYRETAFLMPSTTHWKLLGDVEAKKLPMSCNLMHLIQGSKYYFAVRAVDCLDRRGLFSNIQSVTI